MNTQYFITTVEPSLLRCHMPEAMLLEVLPAARVVMGFLWG